LRAAAAADDTHGGRAEAAQPRCRRRPQPLCHNPLQPPHTTTPTRAAAHALATLDAPQRSAPRGHVDGGGAGGGGSGGVGGGAHFSWRRPPRATLLPVSS